MDRITHDTGMTHYDAEDVCCDFIRWVENYVQPGNYYSDIDRDKVWSSCRIVDHPYGRQKYMLESGMVESFNNYSRHPTGDAVIKHMGITVEDYKRNARDTYRT